MEESTRPYGFGPFRLNPHTLELHRGEEAVPLEPLPARILVRLVDQAGEMVTRRELRELGWPRLPDAAEQSLNTCIRQIRDALGDEASAPEYVQTLRGRGYRFIARVERLEARARPARVGGPRWTSRSALGYPWAPAAIAVALLLLITGVWLADPVTRTMRDGTRTRIPGASDTTASATARALGLSPDAEHRLLKARFLYDDQGDFSLALALVDSVIAEEPELAEAHGLRAELLLFLGRAEAAGAAASRAIALDPRQPDGQRATAGLLMLRGDWEEAESVLHGVLERVPEHVPTLIALAYLLTVRGRFDEAARTIEQSRRVNPLTPVLAGDAGLMHYWAGRYEAAADACQETQQLRPDATWAMACIFDALLLAGRIAEAAEQGRRILAHFGEEDIPVSGAPPEAVVEAVRRWRVGAWEHAVREGAPAVGLALAYADAGREEEALRALESASASPSLSVLPVAVDPRLRRLADDPRYLAVLERLGLAGVTPSD